MSDIDREGIGMLYAGAAGVMVGTSVVYAAKPALGWALGSLVMALALVYDFQQRYVRMDIDHEGGDRGD
jgi:hypothetical protein